MIVYFSKTPTIVTSLFECILGLIIQKPLKTINFTSFISEKQQLARFTLYSALNLICTKTIDFKFVVSYVTVTILIKFQSDGITIQ